MSISTFPNKAFRGLVLAATLALTAITLLAGCGSSSHKARSTSTSGQSVRTAVASNGVQISAHPTRIVSLSPAATDDLYAVGAGSQVVAVDQYSTYPANAPRTKLDGWAPNVEAIAKYNPDLVIVYNDNSKIEAQLAKLEIPVLLEGAPNSLADAYQQIEHIGADTGHAQDGVEVAGKLQAEVKAVAAKVRESDSKITVYMESYEPNNWAATSHSFAGNMLAMFHLVNIADRGARGALYPQLSNEYVIGASPKLIIAADGQTVKQIGARAGWSQIWAVQHNTVFQVSSSVGQQWGPHAILLSVNQIAADVKKAEQAK